MKHLLAQTQSGTGGTQINLAPQGQFNKLTSSSINLPNLISAGLSWILIIAAIAFFFMLVIGGIKWILSGGDKGQTESARNQITAALIGLVIVFAAWAIAALLGQFFGIGIFTGFNLPTLMSPSTGGPN